MTFAYVHVNKWIENYWRWNMALL